MTIMFLSSSSTSLLVLMLAMPVLLATVSLSARINRDRNIEIHIRNELSPGKVLHVRCHCNDHDLGDQYINVGDEFNWNFQPHFIRETLWQCYAATDNNRQTNFHVYDKKTPSFDFDLIFAAKEDGVYYRNQDSHEDELFSSWKLGL
ncbi:S-protein homolog 74 [Linum grandiflorum]